MMDYPVNLDVRGRSCLVVGGGGVGARKARGLVDCDAAVAVVSPEVASPLRELADAGRLVWTPRGYRSDDMAGRFLAFAAAGDPEVNRRVVADARRERVLCNAADRPEEGDFTLPAVLRRGALSIAVSTGGASPALARRVRMTLEATFGPEYERALEILGAARTRLLARGHDPDDHRRRFRAVLDGGLVEMLREGRDAEADRLLRDILESEAREKSDGAGAQPRPTVPGPDAPARKENDGPADGR